MNFANVQFPQALLNAQRDGRLVIFAGAGVSYPPPSSLPDFPKLAEIIGEGVSPRSANEREDQYLGRLQVGGLNVQKLARDKLTVPESKPTELHGLVFRLFKSTLTTRIVTTNFDRHFTTAVPEKLRSGLEIFYAPALPLGREFNGLVYLHGSVDRDPKLMVLTDADFGRAYLTDGWATRFLMSLFQDHVVLFVGYSHNDIVMNYLARGLPPSAQPRFALTSEADFGRWKLLGIEALHYPPDNKHSQLTEALRLWVAAVEMGALDHEKRIKTIAALPPPEEGSPEADYLHSVLADPAALQFFVRDASSIEWLRWAESNPIFKSLFDPDAPELRDVYSMTRRAATYLASWIASMFAIDHQDEVFDLIARNNGRIHPLLREVILDRLAIREPRPASPIMAKWIAFLSEETERRGVLYLENQALLRCKLPDDRETVILLWRQLTDIAYVNQSGEFSIKLRGEGFWLEEAWKKVIRPNLELLAPDLALMFTERLERADNLLHASGRNQFGDPISFSCGAIEEGPHEPVLLEEALRLAYWARQILSWLLANRLPSADSAIRTWVDCSAPLLKRLAIFGVADHPVMKPDEKIKWILDHGLLYFGPHHEVFRLLKTAYPGSSRSARISLIEQAQRGPGLKSEVSEEDKQYLAFSILIWLAEADPGCELAKSAVESLRALHPDWRLGSHADRHFWMGAAGFMSSGIPVEEVLAKDPEKDFDWLVSQPRNLPLRLGGSVPIYDAVLKSFQWGLKLARVLTARGNSDPSLWRPLLQACIVTVATEESRSELLSLLVQNHALWSVDGLDHTMCDLMAEWSRDVSESLPIWYPAAEKLSDLLWADCEKASPQKLEVYPTWLDLAHNRSGGRLVQFWMCDLRQRLHLKNLSEGQKSEFKIRVEKVAVGDSSAAQLGRAILGQEANLLVTLDLQWAQQLMSGILDFASPAKAESSWHGYLFIPALPQILQSLLPYYGSAVVHLGAELKPVRSSFANHVALIVMFIALEPLKAPFFKTFIKDAPDDDLVSFAACIGNQLRGMEHDQTKAVWQAWLRNYWDERLDGKPRTLLEEELTRMAGWLPYLDDVFPEAAARICERPPKLEQSSALHFLSESDLPTRFPDETAKLLLSVMPRLAIGATWFWEPLKNIIAALRDAGIKYEVLKLLCDQLTRLEYPKASELLGEKPASK